MAGQYAAQTEVPAERTQAEIQRLVTKYKAKCFAAGYDQNAAFVLFELEERRIRFVLPLPDPDSREFRLTATGKARVPAQVQQAYEQAVRQRWRALGLVIKAKLEAVESGITSVEEEFLAHIVLPGGGTVGQQVRPKVAEAYRTGTIPALLPGVELPALGAGK